MDSQNLDSVTRVLQASISPVALISGVGLLILSQTNRLGRVMDRLRDLLKQKRGAITPDAHLDRQVTVLQRRARLLQCSVTAAVVCVLMASFLVLILFTSAIFGATLDKLVILMFAASLLALIVSLIFFLFDMNWSLRAVKEESLR